MNEQERKGLRKKVVGKVREEAGKLTGDKKQEIKGKLEQAEGRARQKLGRVQKAMAEN